MFNSYFQCNNLILLRFLFLLLLVAFAILGAQYQLAAGCHGEENHYDIDEYDILYISLLLGAIVLIGMKYEL